MHRHLAGSLADLRTTDRLYATELLDDPSLPEGVVARAYRDLARTHRWLGNTAAIISRLRQDTGPVRSVLDVGCGHGALSVELRRALGVEVTGVDLRPPPPGAPTRIITADAVTDPLPQADVAVSVCLAHHLPDHGVERLIRNVGRSCRRFILLDLVRHPLPLALFRVFVAPLVSPLNAADGRTSIRRAYTPAELRRIVDAAVQGSGAHVSHSVAPLCIRQIVDISW